MADLIIANWTYLDLALAHIAKHPEEYDQSDYFGDIAAEREISCGTTACVAGWITHFAGYKREVGTSSLVSIPELPVMERVVHAGTGALYALGFDETTMYDAVYDDDYSEPADTVFNRLFDARLSYDAVLINVGEMAESDGHTLPAVVQADVNRARLAAKVA